MSTDTFNAVAYPDTLDWALVRTGGKLYPLRLNGSSAAELMPPSAKESTGLRFLEGDRAVARSSLDGTESSAREDRMAMKKSGLASGEEASRKIEQRIRELEGWRGETLSRMRALILAADPEITEEWKWNVPVWSHAGIVCTGEVYTQAVKLTFAHGADLPDPARLFNSSLEGKTRRAIDLREGEPIDAKAFRALVQAAVARNALPAEKAKPRAKRP